MQAENNNVAAIVDISAIFFTFSAPWINLIQDVQSICKCQFHLFQLIKFVDFDLVTAALSLARGSFSGENFVRLERKNVNFFDKSSHRDKASVVIGRHIKKMRDP